MKTLNEFRYEILACDDSKVDDFFDESCEAGLVWWNCAIPLVPGDRPYSSLLDVEDDAFIAEIEMIARDNGVSLMRR